MKKLILGFVLTFFLFCGNADAFVKGDVAYIEKGTWWTISPKMLELIDSAITAKDYVYLASLEDKAYLNIQQVRIKVVVVMKIENKIKVRIFGTNFTLWIWENFLKEK